MKICLVAAVAALFIGGALMLPAAASASTHAVSSASVSSTNYGGYAISFVNPDPQNWPLSVDSTWTVPAYNCKQYGLPMPEGDFSIWDGLGGIVGSNDLEQAGTVSQCLLGIARNYAFVENFPAQQPAVQLSTTTYPVSPGNVMRAAVTEQGPGYFVEQLWNETKHWYYPYIWQTTDPNALPHTADWIVEDPTVALIQQAFPQFTNNIVFQNCYWYQNNAKHPLGGGNSLTRYTIVQQLNPAVAKEVTGSVATNGTTFSIRWQHY